MDLHFGVEDRGLRKLTRGCDQRLEIVRRNAVVLLHVDIVGAAPVADRPGDVAGHPSCVLCTSMRKRSSASANGRHASADSMSAPSIEMRTSKSVNVCATS